MSTPDIGPVPWHTPRVIEGHPDYSWHYQDEGGDLRVVVRLGENPTSRSAVVGSVRVARTEDGDVFTAYDAEGVELGSGPSREFAALVASVDEDRRATPQRCEANARKGTGTGTCGLPLDTHGYCDNPRAHLDPTAITYP